MLWSPARPESVSQREEPGRGRNVDPTVDDLSDNKQTVLRPGVQCDRLPRLHGSEIDESWADLD